MLFTQKRPKPQRTRRTQIRRDDNSASRRLLFEPLENRRLLAAGDLDPTFGIGGKVFTDFNGAADYSVAAVLQNDGKIVAAGVASSSDFALSRYNADGSLDTTFGSGGKVTTDFAGERDILYDAKLQPDGKIVVAGIVRVSGKDNFGIARYNSNGTLDGSFGTGGKVVTDIIGYDAGAASVALQSDGRIVVGGYTQTEMRCCSSDWAVVRYNVDGTLDSSFGSGGTFVTSFLPTGAEGANSVAIDSSGRVVVVGGLDGRNDLSTHTVGVGALRLNSDGGLDSNFGVGGKVITDVAGITYDPKDLKLQPDGKLVVGGYISGDFMLLRYLSDGALDPDFGTGGLVRTDFSNGFDGAWGVAIQSDGKIVMTGQSGDDFGMARYFPDGSLDESFGAGGKVLTDFAGGLDDAQDVAIQGDGMIVVVGQVRNVHGGRDFGISRYFGGERVLPNTPPVAKDDDITTDEDHSVTFDVLGDNGHGADSDADGDPLSVTSINTTGTIGAVTLNAGQVSYSPDGFFEALGAGETALDSFEYTISDGNGGTDTATVIVTVTGQNDAPTATGTLADVTVNQNAANSVIGLTGLFQDVDATDSLTITAVSSASGLVTAGVSGSSLTLDYQANQSGSATITVTATDGLGASVDLTFNVAVLSPAQQGNAIILLIQQWKTDAKINAGVANSMIVKVVNSLKSYDNGNLTAAGNQLTALKNEVRAKVKPGSLTLADATLAIGLIDALYDSMTP